MSGRKLCAQYDVVTEQPLPQILNLLVGQADREGWIIVADAHVTSVQKGDPTSGKEIYTPKFGDGAVLFWCALAVYATRGFQVNGFSTTIVLCNSPIPTLQRPFP